MITSKLRQKSQLKKGQKHKENTEGEKQNEGTIKL